MYYPKQIAGQWYAERIHTNRITRVEKRIMGKDSKGQIIRLPDEATAIEWCNEKNISNNLVG